MSFFAQFKASAIEEFNKFMNQLKEEDFAGARALIREAEAKGNRIHITGIGKAGHVAA